ncbi:MAG: FAD-dependent monooxygenase [Pseudomonadota bacterium]|uniref:FAD-dependent oxidoreductase n=1 Tax=Phenylobacterium sp. TaxID=1871053 RepID=UPI0025EC896A|nr:FAD-dependent monooxygenase [Phenylobacterium sp.]MBT9470568.1 FAD-dependent monooxygenase [Phenylobacterium sp.]
MAGALQAQVVVAGAGPVGLVAALVLARANIEVLVIEKRSGLNTASKASTYHPPTLEILAALGVMDEVLAQGEIVGHIQYRTPEGPFAGFTMADLAEQTAYPFRLHLEQSRVTPLLLAQLQALPNATILFDTAFDSVEQNETGLVVHALRDGVTVEIKAQYLLGTDGAQSAVRQALGVAFDGTVYPDKILRVMTTDDLDVVLPAIAPISYLFNGAKSVSFLKMPDCWRIILRVPGSVPEETALRDDWLLARLQEALPSWADLPTIVGRDLYGASLRVASDYFVGRAFLAGDSAHVTNTRGGMNMNCGVHDAFTLANAMIRGLRENDITVVEAAARERKRIADEMLIPRTDRNVSGGSAWLEQIREISASQGSARDYLATAAMLDMVERSQPAA